VTAPTRIRAVLQGDVVDVRMRLTHDMEMGRRKDADGKLVPAWFVQRVAVTHNGRAVFVAQCGPMISKNPQFSFRFAGGKAGERIVVSWIDNRGEQRSDEAAIAQG
jgi:sulfur-oxidizing protein SoxZ